jgi:aryl-alcohol dehydrogenase-like predicted oxidoreductase
MRYLDVGGAKVSAIGLGTWQFGTPDWGYGTEYATRVAPAIVRRALELGVTLIDTAEVYGDGASERILGAALRDAPRDAFVATKLNPILPFPPLVVRAAERSRDRLQVAQIDLYQVHWPNPVVPVGVQAEGLRRVLAGGIARHVGVSNHSLGRWQAMERAVGAPVLSNQVELSLARPGGLVGLVPYAAAHDRLVIAYSPLGQGRLCGPENPRPNFARRLRRVLGSASSSQLGPVRDILGEVAAAHDATLAQVALAWLLTYPNVVAIPGARSVAQLESNVAAAELQLTPEERNRLSEAAFDLAARRGR